ncbi:hypothetical protein ACFQFQ_16050 [Sulfitobacter porphyrae]|uniref:Uncharacterized protein n=1 Tax=Sulfitobacter porphyrae TaxID=1246864 RepID=A0ABW2B5J0_9RHOB
MRSLRLVTLTVTLTAYLAAGPVLASGNEAKLAIDSFNAWCFKAYQTEAQARDNMSAGTAPSP